MSKTPKMEHFKVASSNRQVSLNEIDTLHHWMRIKIRTNNGNKKRQVRKVIIKVEVENRKFEIKTSSFVYHLHRWTFH